MNTTHVSIHTNQVNQILIASNMVGVVEGLLYAHKAGLDPEQVIAAVGSGAAGEWCGVGVFVLYSAGW
jgi:3-hydroxyisobutyrate dehydrogenase-like beta-hydroxyacid dehydrogenase